jgi:integrase
VPLSQDDGARHLSDDAGLAAFQGRDVGGAAVDVDRCRGQRQDLRDLKREGLIGAGTTLHGLRVSYAARWKRNGANDSEVADLLGDKSVRMGAHYTRHVEAEANVIRAFKREKDAS